MNAKNQILEDYPEAQIEVVDSEEVTALQGMFVEEACRLRGAELDLKEAVKLLEEIRPTGRIFFTTNDLDYLQHGGRIGRAAATIGNVLKIKPMIEYVNKALVSAGVSSMVTSLSRSAATFFCALSCGLFSLQCFQQSLLQCSQLLSLWFLLPVAANHSLQSWKRSEPLPVIFHLSSPLSPGRFRPMETILA